MNTYKIAWDWYNEPEDTVEHGFAITLAESYAEAVKNIEDCFGSDLEGIKTVEMLADGQKFYEMDEDQFNALESY